MKINPKILANAIEQLSTYVKNPQMFKGKEVLNIQQAQILGLMLDVNKNEISKMFEIIYSTATSVEMLKEKGDKLFKMVNEVITSQMRFSDVNVKNSSTVAYNILTNINNTQFSNRSKELYADKGKSIDAFQYIDRALRGEPDIDNVITLLNTIKVIMYKPLTVDEYLFFIKQYDLPESLGLSVQYKKPEPVIEKEPEMDFSADDFNVKLVTLANDADKFHIILKVLKLAKISASYSTSRLLPFLRSGYFVIDLSKKEFIVTDDVQHLNGCKMVYLQTLVDTLNINDEYVNAYLNRSTEPKKIPLGEPITKPKQQVKILDFAGSEPLPNHETLAEIRESVSKLHDEYLKRLELLINRTISHAFNHAVSQVIYLEKEDLDTYRKLVTSHYTGKSTEIQCNNCDKLVKAGLVSCKTYMNTNLGLIDADFIEIIQKTDVHYIFNVKGSYTQGFYPKISNPVYKITLNHID